VDAVDERMLPDDDPVKRAFELVERARMRRGLVRTAPEDLSIPDPMGRPPQAHHAAVRLVTDTVYRITRKIAPPRR
jgi:protein-tyrosine phosphatase